MNEKPLQIAVMSQTNSSQKWFSILSSFSSRSGSGISLTLRFCKEIEGTIEWIIALLITPKYTKACQCSFKHCQVTQSFCIYYSWLRSLNLAAYIDNFHNAGLQSMDQLKSEQNFTIKVRNEIFTQFYNFI